MSAGYSLSPEGQGEGEHDGVWRPASAIATIVKHAWVLRHSRRFPLHIMTGAATKRMLCMMLSLLCDISTSIPTASKRPWERSPGRRVASAWLRTTRGSCSWISLSRMGCRLTSLFHAGGLSECPASSSG